MKKTDQQVYLAIFSEIVSDRIWTEKTMVPFGLAM